MDDFAKYDALAGSINVEDIASDERNARTLRRIMENDPELRGLRITQRGWRGKNCYAVATANAREMGWLGYFLAKSTSTNLELRLDDVDVSSEIMDPFFRGVSRGRSVGTLRMDIIDGSDLLRTMLASSFFENIVSLTRFSAGCYDFGVEGRRQFSLALSCTKSSLTSVSLDACELSDENFGDIAVALSMHPKLKTLSFSENSIGCALADLLRYSAVDMECLDLDNNCLDDEAVETLLPGLVNCKKMNHLGLGENSAISVRGWRALSGLLTDPNCALKTLCCGGNRIDDETIIAFASALATNQSLRSLYIDGHAFTEQGWNAVSALLCDTSSVNKTFLSNHTLRFLSRPGVEVAPREVRMLLDINKEYENLKETAMVKILIYHEDLSVQTFFEWDFKVLPFVVEWFERAALLWSVDVDRRTGLFDVDWLNRLRDSGIVDFRAAYDKLIRPKRNIQPRKLSAIYQFVRGMPQLYVESHLRGELDEIQRNDLTMEQERLALAYRSQALERRKRESGKRKRDVVARLRSG